MRGIHRVLVALACSAALEAAARADEIDVSTLPDLTDNMYGIDLYQGSVLGSVRVVGMGGAQVAIGEGSVGMGINPASAGVRPATSRGRWDWDWYVDWLNPDLASDFDNNGILTEEEPAVAPVVTGGILGWYEQWALGVFFRRQANPTTVGDGGAELIPASQVANLVLARSFRNGEITGGLGIRLGTFEMLQKMGSRNARLFEITGSGLEGGVVWRAPSIDLRVGGSVAFPITGTKVVASCNEMTGGVQTCQGYPLPSRVQVPWRVALGVGWRFAATRWNRKVDGRWRDERSVLLAADVIIVGSSDNAYGLEAFAKKKLQRSGAKTVVSGRGGVEYEWIPGRLRVRAGAYWEPGRFESISGRLHGTGGLDVRVWSFNLWGKPYRVRFSLTADLADRYANAGVSIGFWH